MKMKLPLVVGVLASVILGFGFLAMKTGLNISGNDINSWLAFRYVIAFLVMALMVKLGLFKINLRGKNIRLLLLCGLLNPIINESLELTAFKYVPTSQLALFLSLQPVFVILFSAKINKEIPTKRQFLYLLMPVAGVFVIQFVNSQQNEKSPLGFIIAMLASLIIAVQRVLIRRATGTFSAFEIIFVTAGMGAIYFPVVSVTQHLIKGDIANYFSHFSNPLFVVAIIYISIICYVVGFLMLTYASANLPIAVSSASATIMTVVAVLAGVLILKEKFRLFDAIGAILIIGSVFLMSYSYNPSISHRFGAQKGEDKQAGTIAKHHS